MVALLVLIMATLEIVFCRTKTVGGPRSKVHLAVMFSKIRLDMLLKTRKILLQHYDVQHLREAT